MFTRSISFSTIIALAILSSAVFARGLLDLVRGFVGLLGLQILLNSVFFFAAIALFIWLKHKQASLIRYLGAVILFFALYLFSKTLSVPAEKIHLFEYAFFGWIAMRDCRLTKNIFFAVGFCLVLVLLLGICDELFQQWVPGRFCDSRDVKIDLIGGVAGITGYCLGRR